MAEAKRNPLVNLVAALAVFGVGAAVVYWMLAGDDGSQPEASGEPPSEAGPDVSFGPFAYDVDRLEAEWLDERERDGPSPVEATDRELVDAFYEINSQSQDPSLEPSRLDALSESLSIDVTRYLTMHGPRRYRALGWHLVDEFHEAREAVERQAAAAGVTPDQLLATPTPENEPWRQRLGNFYTGAARSGLLDRQGRLRADPTLATVLFRYRWFSFAREYATISLLTPYEREVLWRWRIEAAEGLPVLQRLALVDELASVYDERRSADAARGILYYEAGQFDQAAAYFRRAVRMRPEDAELRTFLEAAEARSEE